MQALIHSFNIGTLATWLSVAGFGTVGVIVPHWHPIPALPGAVEVTMLDQDFTLGESAPYTGSGKSVQTAPAEPAELPISPPELAPMAELEPLPEIPALPSPTIQPFENPVLRKTGGSPAVTSGSPAPARRKTAASGSGGSGAAAASSGGSSADRLAAGRMPAPSYPAESRRKGQTGTVLVEFTVDTQGRVISAHAKSPSPWPLLNNEAVRTVRCWKFPPGGIMKLQRPIVFQLR